MKVLIIIPHFGNWPPWFAFFLQTCETNPDFSWLIYSDCNPPETFPVNVKFIQQSLQDFNHLASRKLGLSINIINPYKICDLRPAFGKIFEKYINDYEFWGYSDLDLFYGNLKRFLTNDVLANNDLISVRKDYFSGHFALYRNTRIVNSLYSMGFRYKKIFQDSKRHYAYDERSNIYGRRLFLRKNQNLPVFIYSKFEKFTLKLRNKLRKNYSPEDMTDIVWQEKNKKMIRYYAEDMVRSDLWYLKKGVSSWEINWEKGKLYDVVHQKELLHFHIIKSKNNQEFRISHRQHSAGFTITEHGIYSFHQ